MLRYVVMIVCLVSAQAGYAMGKRPGNSSTAADSPQAPASGTMPATAGGSSQPDTAGNAGYYGTSGATTPGTTAAPSANTGSQSH